MLVLFLPLVLFIFSFNAATPYQPQQPFENYCSCLIHSFHSVTFLFFGWMMSESSINEDVFSNNNTATTSSKEDVRVKWTPQLHQSFLSAIEDLHRKNQGTYL